jgi:hypothetical protein
MPKIFVTIPTYKRPELLRETLVSVLNQSLTDWECLVSDNDPDGSGEAVARSFGDRRIAYRRNAKNLGVFGNWNCCRTAAIESGIEYWTLLEDDNIWDARFLETALAVLEQHPECAIYHASYRYFSDDIEKADRPFVIPWTNGTQEARVYGPGDTIAAMICANYVAASVALCRTALVRSFEPYETAWNLCADKIMWGRIMSRYPVVSDPTPLMYYRAHSASVTHAIAMQGGGQRQAAHGRHTILQLALEKNLLTPQSFLDKTDRLDQSVVANTVLAWLRPDAPKAIRDFGRAVLTVAGPRRRVWERSPSTSSWPFVLARYTGDWIIPHAHRFQRWVCFFLGKPNPEFTGNPDLS